MGRTPAQGWFTRGVLIKQKATPYTKLIRVALLPTRAFFASKIFFSSSSSLPPGLKIAILFLLSTRTEHVPTLLDFPPIFPPPFPAHLLFPPTLSCFHSSPSSPRRVRNFIAPQPILSYALFFPTFVGGIIFHATNVEFLFISP